MNRALLELASDLLRSGRPYALATVIARERPSSAALGDTAVITPRGRVHGWVGGSCTRPEVIRHAMEALADGRPRLLGFGASSPQGRDIIAAPVTCGSEGKVEVHVNPVFPAPRLVVAGASPVARAVARLGSAMGYAVEPLGPISEWVAAGSAGAAAPDATVGEGQGAAAPDAATAVRQGDEPVALAERARQWAARPRGARLCAVVATMGEGDESAAGALLDAGPDYLGVVASPKRMIRIRAALVEMGRAEADAAKVRGPAGLDIGAVRPEEVAVSILAEIVAAGARAGGGAEDAEEQRGDAEVDERAAGARSGREGGDSEGGCCCAGADRAGAAGRADATAPAE